MDDIKEKLKEIIVTNQSLLPVTDLIKRDIEIERLNKKATIVLGIRRSGKTSLLLEYISSLINSGLDKSQICHIDFSDDRLMDLNLHEPSLFVDAYYELFPEAHSKKVYFILDEIQHLSNWELVINRLQNTENVEINITGSSSKLLLHDTSSILGGRKLGWEIYCYSYREFLKANNVDLHVNETKEIKDRKINLFGKYLEVGGFPEALLFSKESSRNVFFQNISNDIAFRDIVLRHDVSKPEALKSILLILYSMMSCPMSESKLYQRLQGMRVKVSKPIMSSYLSYIEESYTVYFVSIRSYNLAIQATNPKKIYIADHALAASITGNLNIGQKLENIVFLHLRRKTDKVYYYKTRSGYEVDFAVGNDSEIELVQVSVDMKNESTRAREVRSLIEAMEEMNLTSSTIVTSDEDGEVVKDNRIIRIIPAWRYLLS